MAKVVFVLVIAMTMAATSIVILIRLVDVFVVFAMVVRFLELELAVVIVFGVLLVDIVFPAKTIY